MGPVLSMCSNQNDALIQKEKEIEYQREREAEFRDKIERYKAEAQRYQIKLDVIAKEEKPVSSKSEG